MSREAKLQKIGDSNRSLIKGFIDSILYTLEFMKILAACVNDTCLGFFFVILAVGFFYLLQSYTTEKAL